jgi:predicted nucleic acid-binding Zn ribbon protein
VLWRRRAGAAPGILRAALRLSRRHRTGQDALALDSYGTIDAIITNPPYSRELMHKLIVHFQQIAPTWLLLEMDWLSTKQAAPFMVSCTSVLPIRRVKWVEGSKHTGKDNFGWYRFKGGHTSGPLVLVNDPMQRGSRFCEQCGKPYVPHRSDSQFCSNACRQRAYRERSRRNTNVTAPVAASKEAAT